MTRRRPTGGQRQDPTPSPLISPRLLAGIILTILPLLVVVVAVGLARDTLDPTGVAVVLSTMLSGIVVGVLTQSGKGKGDPP